MGIVTKGIDARLANRSFLAFDFRALWPSTIDNNYRGSDNISGEGCPL